MSTTQHQSTVKHVAFFFYPVKDLARARQFYEGTLGLKLTGDPDSRWLEFDIQGVTFAITDVIENATPCHTGGAIALEVADLNMMVETMKARGVQILREPFPSPVCDMAVIADPDGNGIVLHQAKIAHEGENAACPM